MSSGQTRRSATTDVFDSGKMLLKGALEDIHSGRLKLPNFQRNWKWPDNNICSLAESIAEGHPIGAVMFLEVGGETKFEHRCVEGSESTAADNPNPLHLIMDGQQRLTSLYQMLMGDAPVRIQSDRKDNYRLYYIDMKKAISADIPISEAIISVGVDKNGKIIKKTLPPYTESSYQYQNHVFPLNMTFNIREWQNGFNAYWNEQPSDARWTAQGVLTDFQQSVLSSFTNCMLPVITLRRGMTVEGICRVYEKLNSKGVPLDAFDLLIAQYAGRGFNLREDWMGGAGIGRYARIKEQTKGMLEQMSAKQFLQSISMLDGLAQGWNVLGTQRKDILSLSLNSYLEFRETATKGFIAAHRFMLREKIFSPRDLPPMHTVVALAAILGHLGRKAEEHDVISAISRWLWSVIYTNAYAVGSDMAMATDVPDVVRWLTEGGKEPRSLADAFVIDTKVVKATKRSAGYIQSALGTRMIRSGALDFGTGDSVHGHIYAEDRYDLHHIFPVKWCKAAGIPIERWDSIVNKTPMSAKTNQRMGGTAPSEYIAALEASANISSDRMDEILRSHGVNPVHLRNNDFEAFFAERSSFLFEQVELDIGKPVTKASEHVVEDDEEEAEEEWLEGADMRCQSHGLSAYATLRDGSVVILPGSIILGVENPSLVSTYADQRAKIFSSDAVEQTDDGHWRVLKELEMSSPSGAASVCSGMVKGLSAWRDREGQTWNW